jgi:3-hydroxyisobutyrate dehydrogenase-like beta-hydroxyacid dehydrogenase
MSHSPQQGVLFIGLGVMGYHMAGHISQNFNTFVYNRTETKAEQWSSEFKGNICPDLHALPDQLNYVLTCIGNDTDLKEVYLSDHGLIQQAKPGTILIDHTTASADVARDIAIAANANGLHFIDAPVSGGEQGAINGQLTVMCGGSQTVFEQAKPVMDCYAKAVTLLGSNGAGQLTKMCNQIAIAGLVQGLSESIHFAKQAGLDAQQVIDVISKGAAQSWQMDNRHKTMIAGEYEHGFAVDWMRKDLGICLDEGRRNAAKLPVTALVDQFYADVQAMGGQRWDTSSLLERLSKK